MAITDKEQGVWETDQVYNKIMEGDIWSYTGADAFYMWGNNPKGGLGLNDTANRSSPTQIPGSTWSYLPHCNLISSNVMGGLKTDGTLWTWGNNDYGVLGHNQSSENARYSSPTQVGTDTTWDNISMGGDNAKSCIAVKTDGTLWCWGGNDKGNLGQNESGIPSSRSSPKQVGDDTDWNHGVAGADTMFAIKTNGTLWSWGYGKWYGQLAQNNQTSYSSPRQVGTNTTWSYVQAGRPGAGIATKTDGTLWTWGGNTNGELGHNGPTGPGYSGRSSSPKQVGTGTDWAYDSYNKISMGFYRAGAIKQDGTLWMWGYNANGQLGDNSQVKKSSPIQIPGTWEYVSGTYLETIAKKTDGTLWSWGYGGQGGLGNNTSTGNASRSSPIQVGGDMSIKDGERQMCAAWAKNAAIGKL